MTARISPSLQIQALVALMFAAAVAAAILRPSALAQTSAQAASPAALEERILTGVSQDEVAITATFSGSELFVYGAIARSRFLGESDAPPDVAIVIEGPSSPIIVRKKERIAGLWLNREAIRIAAAPSYYAVASTRPLDRMLNSGEDLRHRISLDNAVYILGIPTSAQDPEQFRRAAVRLRRNEGLYREAPGGVILRGGTLYQTTLELPANIIEGDYRIRVYLVREGRVIDQAQIQIPVRKTGIERFLFTASRETPLLYGLGTLIVALLAGYGASELFRRLRR